MYVAKVPNRSSPPAFLLRESYRDGGQVKSRTLANLSHLPREQIESLRRVLKGETLVPGEALFEIARSLPHGHVAAVLGTPCAACDWTGSWGRGRAVNVTWSVR